MLGPDELERYARHIVLREVGGPGQAALKRDIAHFKTALEGVIVAGAFMPVVAPGSEYVLMTAEQSARDFCDGIAAERVLIVAQEPVSLSYVRRWAASPNAFAFEKIGQYACGEYGMPAIDLDNPEIIAALTGAVARREP